MSATSLELDRLGVARGAGGGQSGDPASRWVEAGGRSPGRPMKVTPLLGPPPLACTSTLRSMPRSPDLCYARQPHVVDPAMTPTSAPVPTPTSASGPNNPVAMSQLGTVYATKRRRRNGKRSSEFLADKVASVRAFTHDADKRRSVASVLRRILRKRSVKRIMASRNDIVQAAVVLCARGLQAEIRGSVTKYKKKKKNVDTLRLGDTCALECADLRAPCEIGQVDSCDEGVSVTLAHGLCRDMELSERNEKVLYHNRKTRRFPRPARPIDASRQAVCVIGKSSPCDARSLGEYRSFGSDTAASSAHNVSAICIIQNNTLGISETSEEMLVSTSKLEPRFLSPTAFVSNSIHSSREKKGDTCLNYRCMTLINNKGCKPFPDKCQLVKNIMKIKNVGEFGISVIEDVALHDEVQSGGGGSYRSNNRGFNAFKTRVLLETRTAGPAPSTARPVSLDLGQTFCYLSIF
ncbi:hypothetical protein EAI_11871 [Harpegnathos saltator]|uniref:Uncharacterized protein n=1 Tax=Harpegnathos saltator TaxID=610380 RepID=E2BTU4_HARSA|nr:hypothetical protein EAI_11871 [Harpegnathos saltator]